MKKTVINLLILAAVVAVTFWSTQRFYPRVEQVVKTDTLIKKVPYKVQEIKAPDKPKTVVKYRTKTDTIETIRVKKDTVYISTSDLNIEYNTAYLTNFPEAPKFLGLEKQNEDLRLSYLTAEGQSRSKIWPVGESNYRIGLNNGNPTLKRSKATKTAFKFGLSGGWIYSTYYTSPYIGLYSSYEIWGITGRAELNINKQPFLKAGIQHEF